MTDMPFPVAPESKPFHTPSSVYFRHMLSGATGKAAMTVSALIVAGFVASSIVTGDIRLLLVALMLLMIAIPMVMAMVYFSIVLSPDATRAMLTHTAEMYADGLIRLTYLPPGDDEPPRPTPPPETFTPIEIKSFSIKKSSIVFTLKSGRLLIIPIDAVHLDDKWYCNIRDFD